MFNPCGFRFNETPKHLSKKDTGRKKSVGSMPRKGKDVRPTERSTEGAKEGRRSQSSEGGGGGGRGGAGKTTNRHSECSASEAPVSLHPTPERKKKKKRRKRRSKSSSEADADASAVQKEGDIVTNNAGSENALVKAEEGVEPRKGCKDCLMENCTGAVTLYRWIFNLLIYSSTLPLLLTGPTTRLSTSASSSRTTWW